MIKYSLIALATTAVLFSVGCDDSECCGNGERVATSVKGDVTKNVAPIVSRVLGVTNNSTKTCTPGSSVSLIADGSDVNSNLDASTYSFMEKVGSNETALNGTITCPAAGATPKVVCATVKDSEGLTSNEVCVNLKAVSSNCNPSITLTDMTGTEVSSVIAGNEYKFENNVVPADCPNAQCTWSVKSYRTADESGTPFVCLLNNSHVGTDDEPPVQADGTYHVNLDGTGNTAKIAVQTCYSVYDHFVVDLNCVNPDVSKSKSYKLSN